MLRGHRSSALASSSAENLPPEAAAIIEAFARGIKPFIVYLILGTVFASMLLPLLIALFYFSTSRTRRSPVFMLNVSALIVGLFLGIWSAHLLITIILSPLISANPSEYFGFTVLWLSMPWIAEAILLIRLLAICRFHGKRKVLALLSFPIILKAVRVPILIIYLRKWKHAMHGPGDPGEIARSLTLSWNAKVLWIAELADNMYMSGTFLYQLYIKGHPFTGNSIGRFTDGSRRSFGSRIRTLFWIASTNFIFPVIFDGCAIVLLFVTNNWTTPSYMDIVNVYITIICTVSATVWSQSMSHQDDSKAEMPLTHLCFARTSPGRQSKSLQDSGGLDATSTSDKTHLACLKIELMMEPDDSTK